MRYNTWGNDGSRTFILKLDVGEKVMEVLRAFCEEQGIRGAWLSGLGAVKDAELGWFDTKSRPYVTKTFPGTRELQSLSGNVARAGEAVVVHAHVLCAGRDLNPVGGHLVDAACAVTGEIELRETREALHRAEDPRFDLKLLDL